MRLHLKMHKTALRCSVLEQHYSAAYQVSPAHPPTHSHTHTPPPPHTHTHTHTHTQRVHNPYITYNTSFLFITRMTSAVQFHLQVAYANTHTHKQKHTHTHLQASGPHHAPSSLLVSKLLPLALTEQEECCAPAHTC